MSTIPTGELSLEFNFKCVCERERERGSSVKLLIRVPSGGRRDSDQQFNGRNPLIIRPSGTKRQSAEGDQGAAVDLDHF